LQEAAVCANYNSRFIASSLVVLCKLRVSPPAPAKKTTPDRTFPARQIRENSKFNGNFTFQNGTTIFVFDFNTSHEHFALCLWPAYAVSMRVFSFLSMYSGFLADIRQ
jgi:hypothetical protein